MKHAFSITILDVEYYWSDLGNTQQEYTFTVRRGGSHPFRVRYLDQGNNAEHESSIEILDRDFAYLITVREDFETALHEYLDLYAHDLERGDFLEFDMVRAELHKNNKAWVAFCPLEVSRHDALRIAKEKDALQAGRVAQVTSPNKSLEVKQKFFKGPSAKLYGPDLCLIDTDDMSIIDTGSFN